MSLKIVTKVSIFKAIVEALFTITEEAVIKIESDKILCKAWDPSHFCAMSMNWPKENFLIFDVTKDDVVGFRMDDMRNVVKRFSDKDADLTISIPDEERILSLSYGEKTFQLRLLQNDLLPDVPDELKVEYDANFDMSLATFNDYIADIKVMSEFMTFVIHDNKAMLECQGDSGRAKVVIKDGVQGEIKTKYNLDLMRGFLSSLEPFIEKIHISLGNNKPLRFRVYFQENQYINFFIGHMADQ